MKLNGPSVSSKKTSNDNNHLDGSSAQSDCPEKINNEKTFHIVLFKTEDFCLAED